MARVKRVLSPGYICSQLRSAGEASSLWRLTAPGYNWLTHWEIQMMAKVSLCQSRLFLFSRLNKIIKSISSSSTCATLWVSVLWPEAGDVSWGVEELFSVTFPSLLGENYTAVPWPAPISCFLFYTLPLSSITWMNYPGGVNQAWTTFYIRFMF